MRSSTTTRKSVPRWAADPSPLASLRSLRRTESAARSHASPSGRLDGRSGHGLPGCRTSVLALLLLVSPALAANTALVGPGVGNADSLVSEGTKLYNQK